MFALGGKPMLVELDKGKNKLQLMMTKNIVLSSDEQALEWSEGLADLLVQIGHPLIRRKVEAELSPGDAQYFESHWNFNMEGFNGSMSPKEFAVVHPQLHHSWRIDVPGKEYLTVRCYLSDWQEAGVVFRGFADLMDNSHMRTPAHMERVLLDTNIEYDAGWF